MRRPARGFTLIELLVAIAVMALVAILSWRGLDGMVRAQTTTQQRADEVLSLPLYPELGFDQLGYVVEQVREYLRS